MRNSLHAIGFALSTFAALISGAAAAQTVADFKGATIGINIFGSVGGGYDTYGRVLARHYGRLIPGNPTVIPKNMPGGLRVANYIYNVAPKDGTELGIFEAANAMESLIGNDQAKFDAAKFGWIGSMNQEIQFCGLWQRPGSASSFQDMLTMETIFGASTPADILYKHPLVLKNVLGAKIRLVGGYAGSRGVNLAMQRGEVNGACAMSGSSIKAQYLQDVKEGRLKLVIQMGPTTTNDFGNVPSVYDYVKTDDDRKVLEFHFKQGMLGRPLAGPPGVSKERLAILRKAFQDTMKDADFLADAQRANIDIDPATGEQAEELLVQFGNYPRSVIEKARAAIMH